MRTDRVRMVWGALVALTLVLPGAGEAQTLDEVVAACDGATPFPSQPLCAPYATSILALGRGLSVVQTAGAPVAGSASTLGKRFQSTPRVALSGTIGFSRLRAPVQERGGFVNASGNTVTFDGSLTVGLTEGFSPQPTVGGVFAVDLVGVLGRTLIYDDLSLANPGYWGYGLRLGVLRESFTLPGVTLSALRMHGGGMSRRLYRASPDRSGEAGGTGVAVIDGTTTLSLRGTVGKEFAAVGVLAGLGWDRTDIDGTFEIAGASSVRVEGLEDDRISAFGGLSRTFLVATVSLEVGWTSGFDGPTGRVSELGTFDPDASTIWLRFGTRLTF